MPYPKNIPLSSAEELIGAALSGRVLRSERVDLYAAAGRVSADDVILGHALPPFAQAAMDGFAVRYDELAAHTSLRVVGSARAGGGFHGDAPPMSAVRVATGAPLPVGYDTIVVDEHCTRCDDRIVLAAIPKRGANVRPAGEDATRGARLVARGEHIGPAHLALLAAGGIQPVRVFAAPRVAIVGLGSELTEPGKPLAADHVYQCNNALLHALVTEAGATVQCREQWPDDPEAIGDALTRIAASADLILTAGGVSTSEFDPLPPLVAQHGHIHFWQIQVKPGHPTLFGDWRDTPLFGLPGNVASVFTMFHVLVKPALRQLAGARPHLPERTPMALRGNLLKSHPRPEIQRGRWGIGDGGRAFVEPLATQQPHRLVSLKDVNALIHLPAGANEWRSGDHVAVERL